MHPAYRAISNCRELYVKIEIAYTSLSHSKASSQHIPWRSKLLENVGKVYSGLDWHCLAAGDECHHRRKIEGLWHVRCSGNVTADLGKEEVGTESIGDAISATEAEQVSRVLDDGRRCNMILAEQPFHYTKQDNIERETHSASATRAWRWTSEKHAT